MVDNVNNKFNIGVQKLGMTSDNRHLYEMTNSSNNPPARISVSDRDNDIFEKNISAFNDTAQNDLDVNALKKKRAKVVGTVLLSGIAGMAIP